MSLSADLCLGTLDRIVERLGLIEAEPRQLDSPFGAVGSQRVFHGPGVSKLVYIGMTAAQISLDSHMVFAFTEAHSAIPHFTLDSVQTADPESGETFYDFHLDLVKRVDVGMDLAYLDDVYGPVNEAYEASQELDGLSAAHLSRRQWAVMSPWMLAHRANAEAFGAIGATVDAYLDQWFALLGSGGPKDYDGEQLAARDAAHRAVLFNEDVDPVWAQVKRLVGEDMGEKLRVSLADPDPNVR